MVSGLWGKKIGMTQIFSDNQQVVPVTAINLADWYITQIKTQEKDNYNAIQVSHLKKKYREQDFLSDWLKDKKKYFSNVREVRLPDDLKDLNSQDNGSLDIGSLKVGQKAELKTLLNIGDSVDVFGITTGKGFAGVVKRHGFAGGRASHGSTMGRAPGSLSFMTSQGRVIKGKKMPGHLGAVQRMTKNLKIIKVEPKADVVFVKGSIPGKSGSLVFVRKCK